MQNPAVQADVTRFGEDRDRYAKALSQRKSWLDAIGDDAKATNALSLKMELITAAAHLMCCTPRVIKAPTPDKPGTLRLDTCSAFSHAGVLTSENPEFRHEQRPDGVTTPVSDPARILMRAADRVLATQLELGEDDPVIHLHNETELELAISVLKLVCEGVVGMRDLPEAAFHEFFSVKYDIEAKTTTITLITGERLKKTLFS